MMKKTIALIVYSMMVAIAADAFARGGGGGRGGGFGGGRSFSGLGGGFSGYGGRSPSFGGSSFARGSMARPSYGPRSYSGGVQRSNFGANSFANRSLNGGAMRTTANRPTFSGNGATNLNRNNFGVGNRPNIDGNRAGNAIGNHNDFNRLNPNRSFNQNNWASNRANWNNNINRWANRGNRPWTHPWYNHYDHWHNGWHHGYWNYWGRGYYPWAWFGAGALTGGWWGWPGTGYAYSNPYYVAPAYVNDGYYSPDYSQPIPPPVNAEVDSSPAPGESTPDDTNPSQQQDPKIAAAMAVFNDSRTLFKQGDYDGALKKVDHAIQGLPSDAALHEFRAACLFALGKYKEAAAGVYAVLSAGPGWDWDTMKALYPDTATYTKRLRALEAYKKENPSAPDASFLLAYEYLVLGFPDQAAGELKQVVKLQPDDKLSAALLQALENRNDPQQQPAPGQAPEQGT
ncbi:MAG: tetratricopeptide repeat protein [Pirellulales bacterium]|nr:tetratricopeptide repeat protein [Pirellulales bacterium]